jgi:hypothetical protein
MWHLLYIDLVSPSQVIKFKFYFATFEEIDSLAARTIQTIKHIVLVAIHCDDVFKTVDVAAIEPIYRHLAEGSKKAHTEAAYSYQSCISVCKNKAIDSEERKHTSSPPSLPPEISALVDFGIM